MADEVAVDDAAAPVAPTTATRWTADISTSFFNAFSTILSDDVVATVSEADFRLALIEYMQQAHNTAFDSSRLKQRLGEAAKYATDFSPQLQLFNQRRSRWEENRDAFLAMQRERRQARALRAARRRPSTQPVDSDTEFDIEQPPSLTQSELQLAKLAAFNAYERVRSRFEAEKVQRKAESAAAANVTRKEAKRVERQRQLMSTLPLLQAESNDNDAPSDDSASSSSVSSPSKRKFNAAAVVGAYTAYCAAAVVNQTSLAADLRQALADRAEMERKAAEATSAWRERKFIAEQEYRAQKLRRMDGNKENSNPNIH